MGREQGEKLHFCGAHSVEETKDRSSGNYAQRAKGTVGIGMSDTKGGGTRGVPMSLGGSGKPSLMR